MPSQKITNRIYFPIGCPFPTNIFLFLLHIVGSVSKQKSPSISLYQKNVCTSLDALFVEREKMWFKKKNKKKTHIYIHYSAHPSLQIAKSLSKAQGKDSVSAKLHVQNNVIYP